MKSNRPFRWAILGTGEVSRRFVLDLGHAGACAHIVASRDRANAERFAASLSVPEVAQEYAAAVAADVDAVYVATPPALHEAHAMMAIAAGKPVLVEKPFALDAAAAARIASAARDAGVPCIEALWTRFQPVTAQVQEVIASGRMGRICGFDARFMAANDPTSESSLYKADIGGGALLHRGVYPLSLARSFLGPVTQMYPVARIGDTGVDEDSVLVLRHTSGALSTLRSSLRTAMADHTFIAGTKATLYLEGPIYRPTGAYLVPTIPAGPTGRAGPRKFEGLRESKMGLRLSGALRVLRARRNRQKLDAGLQGNGYHYQVKAMMGCVREGRTEAPQMPLDQSVEIMRLIDEARRAWGMMP